MKKGECYIPTEVDKEVARRSVAFADAFIFTESGMRKIDETKVTGRMVANLRQAYDEAHPYEKVDWAGMKWFSLVKMLGEFQAELRKKQATKIRSNATNLAGTFYKLKLAFPGKIKNYRVNMIMYRFSKIVDELYRAEGGKYSRLAIVNGLKDANGNIKHGEVAIFERLYKDIYLEMYKYQNSDPVKAKAYYEVLENWEALVTLARIRIRDTEGLILGSKSSYAAAANSDNFSLTDLETIYDVEESTREGWQEVHEALSSYSSLGREMRKVISTLPMLDKEGNELKDDLGYTIFMNPIEAYQRLQHICRGCTSHTQMMRVLKRELEDEDSEQQWLKPIIKLLTPTIPKVGQRGINSFSSVREYEEGLKQFERDLREARQEGKPVYTEEQIATFLDEVNIRNTEALKNITIFYCSLNRAFNLLSVIKTTIKDGVNTFKTFIINRNAHFNYTAATFGRIKKGIVLNTESSFYTREGKLNIQGIKELRKLIEAGVIGINSITKEIDIMGSVISSGSKKDKIKLVVQLLQSFGMQINPVHVENLLKNTQARRKLVEEFTNLYKFGLNTRFMQDIINSGKETSAMKVVEHKNTGDKVGIIENSLDKIARIVAPFSSEQFSYEDRVPYFDKKGKKTMLSSYINPSYLSTKMDKIASLTTQPFVVEKGKSNPLQEYLEKEFFDSPFYAEKINGEWVIHNQWLRELYYSKTEKLEDGSDKMVFAAGSFAANFRYHRMLGDDYSSGTQRFEDFTRQKHAVSMLQEFVGPREIGGSNTGFGNFSVFIQGDSGVSKYIKAKVYNTKQINEQLYTTYQQELTRMRQSRDANRYLAGMNLEGIENFKNTDTKFTLIPELNDFLEASWTTQVVVENGIEIEKEVLTIIDRSTKQEVAPAKIKEYINKINEAGFNKFVQLLRSSGVLDKIENAHTGHEYKFVNNLAYPHENVKIGSSPLGEAQLMAQLKSFYLNHKINLISQIEMFSIDLGFYAGVKDFQKRFKEVHAPGVPVDVEAFDVYRKKRVSDGIERCIYFDDMSVDTDRTNPKFMNVIRETFKDHPNRDYIINLYKRSSLTDGQGYRTLESYRKVMIMAGESENGPYWSPSAEEAYNKIQAIRSKGNLTEQDIAELAELAVIFQPLKPFLYTHEKLPCSKDGCQYISVQHKYAEVVLIPELLPEGSALRQLAVTMEENNIDMACSTKAVKVGSFGSIALDYKVNSKGLYVDASGNVIKGYDKETKTYITPTSRSQQRNNPNFLDNVVPINNSDIALSVSTGYIHQLNYADYRLQTNVPNHANEASLFGTQVRKLIMLGLTHSIRTEADRAKFEHYAQYLTDENGNPISINLGDGIKAPLNGKRLLWFYNQLICSNIVEGLNSFLSAIGDDNKVSMQLIQNVISNNREAEDHLLAYSLTGNGDFLLPLFEMGINHESSGALLSVLKKLVNKQKISGGSLVQASSWGITQKIEDNKNIDDGGLQYVVSEDGKNVLYAECEIPFNFSITVNGKAQALDFNKYCYPDGTFRTTKIKDKGVTKEVPLIEKDYPGILDIVAYRIPTESHYSMMNLRVVKCSNPSAGGVIKVPAQGVTQAGFDFDIDKLYLMRKEFAYTEYYHEDSFSKEELNEIWKEVYEQYPHIKSALELIRGNNSKYPLNSFWDSSSIAISYDKQELFSQAANKLIENGTIKKRDLVPARKLISDYKYDLPCISYTDNDGNKVKGNSRIARNNMLLHLIQQRLRDPETLETRFKPGGFPNSSLAARTLREFIHGDIKEPMPIQKLHERVKSTKDPEPEYNFSDPATMLIYNQQNQIASKLIGIFANQNANHALAQLLRKYETVSPIAFGEHPEGLQDLIHNPESFETVSEFLAASVDAVKDPVLNFLNLNELTADAGAVLARLGYSTTEIGLLFNQPAIKYICDISFNENISLTEAVRRAQQKYVKYDDVLVPTKTALSTSSLMANIIAERDNSNILDSPAFSNGQHEVISLFSKIIAVTEEVSEFVHSTRWTASNSAKTTMGEMYAHQYKVRKSIREKMQKKNSLTVMEVNPEFRTSINSDFVDLQSKGGIIGEIEIGDNVFEYIQKLAYNPMAYEQTMFDAYRLAVKKLSEKFYPYETPLFVTMREALDEVSLYGINGDMIEEAHKALISYILRHLPESRFNMSRSINRKKLLWKGNKEKIRTSEYFDLLFVDKVVELIKESNNEDSSIFGNKLLQSIIIEENKKTGLYTIQIPLGKMKQAEVDDIITGWEQLLNSNDSELIEIAEDLFYYEFYKNNGDFSVTGLLKAIPTLLKANTVIGFRTEIDEESDNSDMFITDIPLFYRDILKAIQQGKVLNFNTGNHIKRFLFEFISDNRNNNRLVYKTSIQGYSGKNKAKQNTSSKVRDSVGRLLDTFTVSSKDFDSDIDNNIFIHKIVQDPNDSNSTITVFKPAVLIDSILYICDNGSSEGPFNTTLNDSPITYRCATTDDFENVHALDENVSENNNLIKDDEIQNTEYDLIPNNFVIGEWVTPGVTPSPKNSIEQSILDNMSPSFRKAYESLSEERKQEILEGIKAKKCYEIQNGEIKEAIC